MDDQILDGYVEYQKREFCRVVSCPVQNLLDGETQGSIKYNQIRLICQDDCLQTSHAFHKYLIDNHYQIIRRK